MPGGGTYSKEDRNMKCELTSKLVRELALPAGKADVIFWDARQPGLGLRVRIRNGRETRTWIAQRKRHGRAFKNTLGKAAEIGIDVARRAARDVLSRVDLGHDPGAERRAAAAREQRTMAALVTEYLEDKKQKVRPHTLGEVTRYLTAPKYFKPLHNVPVHEIDRARVASCVRSIVRECGAPTAREARGTLSAFFAWAMGEGLAEANPVIGTNTPEMKSRDRVLSDAELASVWRACQDNDYGRIIRLLILLGARRQEVGGMRFSELDLERDTWALPSERSKNARKHVLPLVPTAIDIINGVPRVRDQLFGVRANGFANWGENKKALDERSGVSKWTVHDLRRSVATKMCEDCKVLPHLVEQILNHQSGHKAGVAGTYNLAVYASQVREALLMWESHVLGLVAGERKVVAFKTA
jgi:integrase